MPKRILQGEVVSQQPKTVIVRVSRTFKHPLYGKTVRMSKKYAAHDPDSKAQVGEVVRIIESRPISKTKKWLVIAE